MDEVMIKLFNMSLTAVWLILAVIVLRLILKKAPKYINLIMWAFVGLRLVCPFTFESVFSLIPSAETIPSNAAFVASPSVDTGFNAVNEIINPVVSDFAETPYSMGFSPVDMLLRISFAVWASGAVIMLVYSFFSYFLLKRKVKICVRYDDNIYLCDNIKTPFILGVFRPKIYLPSDINANQISCVIAHEKSHIARLDHIWKPLGFVILCIHWFNPFVWLSYNLFCRDIEYACDERVIKSMKNEEKADYSETLLSLSAPKYVISACPLAFGEVGVKSRIKSVLNYKKPALWIIIVAVIALVAVAVGFMTNPASDSIDGYHYVDKYFYDYVIGEERANNEMRDISYRIGEDMVLTKFFGTGQGNAETLGTLARGGANDYEVGLVLETLPAIYTRNSIKEVYGASFYLSDKYVFIMFRNGDFIGAYLPTGSDGNYYVMNSFKLKRNPDVIVEEATEFTDLYIPGTTTNENVKIGIIDLRLTSSPYVIVKWDNNTGDNLVYGTMYGVYRHENGEKIDCNAYEDRAWTMPLCMTSAKHTTRKFSLAGYDISRPGRYTVEFSFGVGGADADPDEFTAAAEFFIEEGVSQYEVPTSDPSVKPSATGNNESDTTTAIAYDNVENLNPSFEAKVLEVNEKNILVEPLEGEDERKSASRIYVSTDVISTNPVPEIKKGDTVTVVYNGEIQETYPAQINKVFAIYMAEE